MKKTKIDKLVTLFESGKALGMKQILNKTDYSSSGTARSRLSELRQWGFPVVRFEHSKKPNVWAFSNKEIDNVLTTKGYVKTA